jgi:hypothetical protein
MTKLPSVNLHLAEAQSCITVARTLLVDQMREARIQPTTREVRP